MFTDYYAEQSCTAGRASFIMSQHGMRTPGDVAIELDGRPFASLNLSRTVPLAFLATETFDVAADLGSPVSPAYAEKRPFGFEGEISRITVELDE